MPVVSASRLSRSFGVKVVLEDVTVAIDNGERVGLVGPNGSGKSTLARILAGVDHPDAGEVIVRRDAAVAYLEQEPRFPAGLSAREAVLAGLGPWSEARARYLEATRALERGGAGEDDLEQINAAVAAQAAAASEVERLGGWDREHEADALLDRLGIADPETPVETMSGGERRRVALARILARRPALAILDEPTNHLDVATIEWLEQYLVEQYPGALLLITHDRYVLDRVAGRTLELARARVHSYEGGYEAYLAAKAERDAIARRTEANRQNFLRRELEWLRRQPKARTGKQKARIQRIQRAAGDETGARAQAKANFALQAARSGKTVLELRELHLELPDRVLVDRLTLALGKRERVGVIGPNGCGKTTLLRALTGDRAPDGGVVVRGRNTRVAYLDQTREGLDDSKTVFDNVAASGNSIELGGRTLDLGRYLERFLFDPSGYAQKVGTLSGGERARVALAKLLIGRHNLVLLDEPTNDLDTDTLAAVEEMLLEFEGAAIVVTHDRWFLDRVATSILAFSGDGVVEHYQGNYSTYLALAPSPAARQSQASPREASPAARPESTPKARRLTYAEQRELDGLLDQIEAAEERVAALETALADPALYEDGGAQIRAHTDELAEARAEATRLTARWEELEAIREASEA
ncbi:MAG: ABC-F family ATP-binding cassette domain-containing protein [Myxococcales bacterium]|nr:ABC-F family ATP-binding cassette domain-containing protein [Myxococcales bacterium]